MKKINRSAYAQMARVFVNVNGPHPDALLTLFYDNLVSPAVIEQT
jgi:hypothetical protein